MAEAKSISEELDVLLSKFRGFDIANYNRNEYVRLLSRLETFENSVSSLDFMVYFYGYTGRTALNAQNFTKATMYALASLEVCKDRNDLEGVEIANRLLCDIALSQGSTLWASHYYKLGYPGEPTLFSIEKNSQIDDLVQKLFQMKKRPSSPISRARRGTLLKTN